MPRCSVCAHPDLAAIDESLVEGASKRAVAGQYGLAATSVERHRENHLPAKLLRAHQARELSTATELLHRALRYEQRAQRILDTAEEGGDLGMALRAITTARNTLALLVRMRETYELERRLEQLEDQIRRAELGKRGLNG